MKHLYCLPLMALLFACGTNSEKEKTNFSNLTFSVDTVMVDSRDEILYLSFHLSTATLSEDRKYLYNFNNDVNSLEIIDLDNLTFLERHPFEKEGPDGTGRSIQTSLMLDEENILLSAFQQSGVFDKYGRKTKNINLRYADYEGELPGRGESLSSPLMFKNQPNHFYGIYRDFEFNAPFLGKLDLENKRFEKIELPGFSYLKNFFVQLIGENGFPQAFLSPMINGQKVDDKLIFSNSVASDLYIYDSDRDSLYFKSISHKIFNDRKTGKYPQKVESMEEFQQVNQAFGKEINFRAPLWDEENRIYYRLATHIIWKEVEGKMRSTGAEVFMAVLDEDFNVLSEHKVDELKKNPGYHFLKDGKIWIFENLEDEMGFIRLSFN